MLFKLGHLSKAIAANDIAQVKDLLARYPQLLAKTHAYECMDVALAKASDEMVLLLSDSGCNLLATNRQSHTALQQAVHCGRHAIVTQWLERYPLLWTEADRARLLLVSVLKKDMTTLQFLIDSGISNPAYSLPYYEDPLHKAQTERYQDAVQILRSAIAARNETQDLRETVPAIVAAVPAATQAQWHMVDDTTIIRVREQREAGYRLTDIFNFAMGVCTSVQRNLETGQETAVVIDLTAPNSEAIEREARAALEQRGGTPPELARATLLVKKPAGGHDV